jgi:putative transposase
MTAIVRGMKSYSQDLRDRIITALEAGTEPQRAIAERFGVSGSCVEKLWQRWRRSGSSAPKPHAGGQRGALKDPLALLRTAVAKQPEATLAALRDPVVAAQGPRVSPAPICRALQRLRLARKKSRSRPRSGTPSASRPSGRRSVRMSRCLTSTA